MRFPAARPKFYSERGGIGRGVGGTGREIRLAVDAKRLVRRALDTIARSSESRPPRIRIKHEFWKTNKKKYRVWAPCTMLSRRKALSFFSDRLRHPTAKACLLFPIPRYPLWSRPDSEKFGLANTTGQVFKKRKRSRSDSCLRLSISHQTFYVPRIPHITRKNVGEFGIIITGRNGRVID